MIFLVLMSLSFVDCAKRGNPEGGSRDSIAPIILRSVPENFTTNFKGDEIRIYFDEYIKLKNAQEQIIISPPLDNQPSLYPFSTSKYVKINFIDTLKENTTYSINFGNSIVDNNEENPFEHFKYVFSTGSYIDSLKINGTVSDALKMNPEEDVTIMLYEVDENYNDSIIYNRKPLYVSNTQVSPGSFEIDNLKEGTYLLVGVKDNNSNYLFDPKTEKIGFTPTFINVPTDSTFHLNLFKEIPAFELARPTSLNSQKIQFGYEGIGDSLEIEMLSSVPQDFEHTITKDLKSDSLYYWFQPIIETDSLIFKVSNLNRVDTVQVRMQKAERDSLELSSLSTGVITFEEVFKITANSPIRKVDREKIEIIDKDSLAVEFNIDFEQKLNTVSFDFEKAERQAYTITLFPEAITDFFGTVNDTISFKTNTRTSADYGFLSLSVVNPKTYPIIVQIVTENGSVSKTLYGIENETTFNFENISPGNYYVRVIYDENENGVWDTGDFLERKQPEEVVYFPKLLDIRANWTLNETFQIE